jgi:hypothetical protein
MNGDIRVRQSFNCLKKANKCGRFLIWNTSKDTEVKGPLCAHVFIQLHVSRSK